MTLDRLKLAVGTFGPYKAPEGDGIFPMRLKKRLEMLVLPLCQLIRASLARGYIPSCWQGPRVVFIPKTGRAQHGSVKD